MSRARRGFRDRWRAEVIKTGLISDSVRVVLIVLADSMTDAGYVSVPRAKLAELVGRSPRRITERIEKARQVGYLDVVRRGQPGRTAEYCATLPAHGAHGRTTDMVRIAAPIQVRTGAPPWESAHGADGGPANARVTNARRDQTDNGHDSRADHITERRSDEEVAGHSPLAAVFRLDRPQSGAG